MKKIIIGNWKQNPKTSKEALKIISSIKPNKNIEMVVCPPFPFLSIFSKKGSLKIGAQDVSSIKEGAHTGEVGASMLKSVGVDYVIVGHSERRSLGDTGEVVATKANLVLKNKMSPVICIGEKERHHDGEHWAVISRELHASLSGISKADIKKVVIAYEPIWAIGSHSKGAMKVEDIAESVIFIRKVLSEMYSNKIAHDVRVVYGGSVDVSDASSISLDGGVSGFLIGRESLNPKHFDKIALFLK